jgi:hypothetical protein
MTLYSSIIISVDVIGTDKHPDDGPGRWFKAYLVYGDGERDHIEAFGGSPKEAADFALDVWMRKEPAHGKQAGGTQPPAEGDSTETMDADDLRRRMGVQQ